MALKALLETLEGVDDAVKPFYAERDGKYVLDVEGVDDHPEVANLKNAYGRTKEDREKAKTEAATLKAQIAELQRGAPDTAAIQAKIAELNEKLGAVEAERNDWKGKYVGKTRDEALTTALQSSGVTNPAFLKAAQAMLSGMVKLGEDGTAYVETPMGPKTVDVFAKGWAASEGKDFVTAAQGGGARGNDGTKVSNTMKRAEFLALPPARQAELVKSGVTPID